MSSSFVAPYMLTEHLKINVTLLEQGIVADITIFQYPGCAGVTPPPPLKNPSYALVS